MGVYRCKHFDLTLQLHVLQVQIGKLMAHLTLMSEIDIPMFIEDSNVSDTPYPNGQSLVFNDISDIHCSLNTTLD